MKNLLRQVALMKIQKQKTQKKKKAILWRGRARSWRSEDRTTLQNQFHLKDQIDLNQSQAEAAWKLKK